MPATSLTTTLRYIRGISSHLSQEMVDFLDQAEKWADLERHDGDDRRIDVVKKSSELLSQAQQSSWSSVSIGALIDLACDPSGAVFLSQVSARSTPFVSNLINKSIHQAQLILNENTSFQDIPSLTDFMKDLGLEPCRPKSLSL